MFADVQTEEQTPWWKKRNRFDPTQGDSLDDEDNIELSPTQRVLGMDRGTMAPAGNDVRTTPPDSPELVSFPMPHDLTPPDTRLADAAKLSSNIQPEPAVRFPGLAKYRKVVSEQPDPSQYKPSIGRRIAAAMATFGTELRAPGHGAELGESILNQPRDRAMADYQNRVKAALNEMNADKEQADIERIGAQTQAFKGTEEERLARAARERNQAANPPVTKETLQNLYAGAVKQAMDAGRDPGTDLTVEKYRTAIQDLEKQGTKTETDKYIERFLAMSGLQDTPANRQKGFDEYNNKTRVQPGVTRLQVLGDFREPAGGVTDTRTDTVVPMSWNEYNRAKKEFPGRYVSARYDAQTQASIGTAKELRPGGAVGKQLISYDAFLLHTGDLYNAIAGMNNTDFPFMNKPLNWLRTNSGDPRVQTFLAKLEPVQKEFESFLLNNRALYQDDRESAKKIFNENMSPAQMLAVLPSIAHTGTLRLQTLNAGVHRAMGRNVTSLVSPEAGKVLDMLGVARPRILPEVETEEGQPSAPPAGPTARPAPAAPQGQKVYTQADVDAYVKKTGQPASAFEDNLRAKGWKKQ